MSKSQAPVSVVIPCYRCAKTIDRALLSIVRQTWQPAEVILVEDCSGDETLSKLHMAADKYPAGWIKILTQSENAGPGSARNVGIANAMQPFVAFLDADDAWHATKIDIQLGWMLLNPDAAMTGHSFHYIASENEAALQFQTATEPVFKKVSFWKQLLSNQFATRSVIMRRDLMHRFQDRKYHSEDFLLWCEICADGYSCFVTELELAFVYKHDFGDAGLSSNLRNMQEGELDSYRRLKSSNRIDSISFFLLYAISLMKFCRRIMIVKIRGTRKYIGV